MCLSDNDLSDLDINDKSLTPVKKILDKSPDIRPKGYTREKFMKMSSIDNNLSNFSLSRELQHNGSGTYKNDQKNNIKDKETKNKIFSEKNMKYVNGKRESNDILLSNKTIPTINVDDNDQPKKKKSLSNLTSGKSKQTDIDQEMLYNDTFEALNNADIMISRELESYEKKKKTNKDNNNEDPKDPTDECFCSIF